MLNGSSQLPLKLLLILMFNIMKTEKEFTVIGRAMVAVVGFDRMYWDLKPRHQRTIRLTGFDHCRCPNCKIGTLHLAELLPRIRSPDNVFYPRNSKINL